MSDLLKRLRGKYSVGPQGVYEDRDFGNFTPAICQEAADEIEQLRAQLAHTKSKFKEIVEENRKLEQQRNDLEIQRFKRFNDEECWMYQGDGNDFFDSLVCPVVISAPQIKELEWLAALGAQLEPQSGEAFAIGYFDSYGNLTEWKSCDIKAEYLPKNCAEFLYTSPPAAKMIDCTWHCDDDESGIWVGSCGAAWHFESGGPVENEQNYCPSCGGKSVLSAQGEK